MEYQRKPPDTCTKVIALESINITIYFRIELFDLKCQPDILAILALIAYTNTKCCGL